METRRSIGQQCRRGAVMMAAAATLALTGCAATQQVAVRDDATITKDVQARLSGDPTARNAKIAVDTKAGVVHLSGAVATDGERTSAEQLARDTPGVRSVDNDVRFGGANTMPGSN